MVVLSGLLTQCLQRIIITSEAIWLTRNGRADADAESESSVDGAQRKIAGQGLVMRNGTNLRFTDLAPGASSPMVMLASFHLAKNFI